MLLEFLQDEPATVYDKIAAMRGEFSEESQASTFWFEMSILGGILLLLVGAYWIVSRRIERQVLVRRGDVDGGTAGSFEFEFPKLNLTRPTLLFYTAEGRRCVVTGEIDGESEGSIQFRPEEIGVGSGAGRMVGVHESGAGRAFRINATKDGERILLLKPFGSHPVETFGESRRVETNIKLQVSGKGFKTFESSLVDLSRSGGGFISEHQIPSKGFLDLSFRLPTQGEPFLVKSKIVWSDSNHGNMFRAGVVFRDASMEFKAHLHDFLSEETVRQKSKDGAGKQAVTA